MFYSITAISLAAQALSTAALSQSYPCYSLATSQYPSQAQIHTSEDSPAVAADQNTSHFPLGGLACMKSAYMKTSSSEGGGAQTQPQRKDEETTKEKSKVTSQSSDEDDYILDESGCPDLTKNTFYCLMCGGSDENGKCKGDPEDDKVFAGCKCTPDPDWSVNPPGLKRPKIREHRQAIRDLRLRRDDEVEGPGRSGNVSSFDAATVAAFTQLPLVRLSECLTLHRSNKEEIDWKRVLNFVASWTDSEEGIN